MKTLKNIMENGAFAQKKQMLHFPLIFQVHDISKVSKGKGLTAYPVKIILEARVLVSDT